MNSSRSLRRKNSKIRKSLRYSFWDGFFASIQFGIVDQFYTPLAMFMGAGNAAIGWLNFAKNALVSLAQLKSADLTLLLRSRKKLIASCILIAALLWVPTFFLPFVFSGYKVFVFIVLFSLTSIFNLLPNPAWASLMAEYIPSNKRGKYFGWRGSVLGIVYTLSVLFAGFILSHFCQINLFLGYAVIFGLVAITRLVSWYFLTLMYEPPWAVKTGDYFSFFSFIRHFFSSNFARFAVFAAFFVLGVNLAAPFLPVYMLRELKFTYLQYTILSGAAVLTSLLTLQYWGYFTDRYGNMKILRFCALCISMVPFLWIFLRTFPYLLLLQLAAGFCWAGLTLASTNFIYDVAVPAKRERCIAYYNFLSGMGIAFGALLGGGMYRYLPAFLGSPFYLLFILSFLVRLLSTFCIVFFTKEVRAVENVRAHILLFDLLGMRFMALLGREMLQTRRGIRAGK